jgi:hypothetical protein
VVQYPRLRNIAAEVGMTTKFVLRENGELSIASFPNYKVAGT